MAAVIRLKRRVDEDPLNAFVLNCKRQRTSLDGLQQNSEAANGNSSLEETSTVLKFAGTFEKPDSISTHLQHRLSKEEAREIISRVRRPAIVSKNRAASRQNAQNSRFRIVNCTRSLLSSDEAAGEVNAGATTIVDVERDVTGGVTNGESPVASNSSSYPTTVSAEAATTDAEGYVYDLYVADENQPTQHIPYIPDNLDDISVAIYDDPLYCSHRGLGDRSDESDSNESEDSNDENNWRNDYPDEDDENSVNEDDMRQAVAHIDLDCDRNASDSDISAYSSDSPSRSRNYFNAVEDSDDDSESGYDVDPIDVQRFGTAYARYKARIGANSAKRERTTHSNKKYLSAKGGSDYESSESDDSDSTSEDLNLYD